MIPTPPPFFFIKKPIVSAVAEFRLIQQAAGKFCLRDTGLDYEQIMHSDGVDSFTWGCMLKRCTPWF